MKLIITYLIFFCLNLFVCFAENQIISNGNSSVNTPKGFIVSVEELKYILNMANQGIQPYSDNVREFLVYINNLMESSENWPELSGEVVISGGSTDPVQLSHQGAKLVYGTAIAWHLTGEEKYAARSRELILDLTDTYGYRNANREVFTWGAQGILNLARGGTPYIYAADLLEGWQGWSANDKLEYQLWLRDVKYPKVASASRLRKNNWGVAGSFSCAAIAFYLMDHPEWELEEIYPYHQKLSPQDAFKSHNDFQLGRQNTTDEWRMDSNLSLWGILPNGAIPEEIRRGEDPIDGDYLPSKGSGTSYTMTYIEHLTAHAEFLRRRGDNSIFENVAKDGSESLLQAYRFVIDNSRGSHCFTPDRRNALYIAYNYYKHPALLQSLQKCGPGNIEGQRMALYGRLTHPFEVESQKASSIRNTIFEINGNEDEVMLVVHDREITKSEFLYYYQKANLDSGQDMGSFLEQFIDFHLKLANARDENLHRNITFINELTDYRINLATPYLRDKAKEEEFAREAYDRLLHEVKASHILVKIDTEETPADTLKAYNKAMQIREKLLKGDSFEQVARKFSDDPNAQVNGGDLGYFTAFQSEYSFETAVFYMNPGELSMPVRTPYGFHIIKCHDKRNFVSTGKQETPPYELMKETLVKSINNSNDIRTEIIRRALAVRLKKEWNFTENRDVLVSLIPHLDEKIYTGDWEIPSGVNPEQVLCTIDGKNLTIKDFAGFMSNHELNSKKYSPEEYMRILYDQFVVHRLITYENFKLEEKYPQFRYQFWEYRDGMLLLEITNRQVWLKSALDTAGLADYFAMNRNRYMWDERVVAGIYTSSDKRTSEIAFRNAAKSIRRKNIKKDWYAEFISGLNRPSLIEQKDTFFRGDQPLIDQVSWKKGVNGIYETGDEYIFVVVYDLIQPSLKTFTEAQDRALSDYQEHLMNTWLNDLRGKYEVKVNQEVLISAKNTIFTLPVFQLDLAFPTADKPQSKLWYMYNTWWTLLPRASGPSLWQRTESGWREHAEVTENLAGIPGRADVWMGRQSVTAVGVGQHSLSVFRLISDATTKGTTWRARVLAELVPPSSEEPIETATIAQDGLGDYWVATVADTKVYVWNSSSAGTRWSPPVLLAEGLDIDDICVVTPIPGGVGVIWSDQVKDAVIMREHRDGNPPETWSKEIVIDSGNNTADDHLNTSLSPDGTLWVTSKNSVDMTGEPQFVLRIRNADGQWINRPYLTLENRMKRPSRPIVIATEDNSIVLTGHGDNDRSVAFPHDAVIEFSVIDTTKAEIFSNPKIVIAPAIFLNSFVQNVTGPRHPYPVNVPWIILASDSEGRVYEADLRMLVMDVDK